MAEFAVALLVAGLTAPWIRGVLMSAKVMDIPNARSSHREPVVRGGGIACGLGILAGVGTADALGGDVRWDVLASVALLSLVGLVDDVRDVGHYLRLALQLVAGAGVGWLLHQSLTAAVIGALLMALLVNSVNFMDGINGITSATAMVWGAAAAVAGYQADSSFLMTLGLTVSGAAAGFLPFNLPVARMFLGDCGSYLVGASMCVGILVGQRDGAPMGVLIAPLVLYLVDVLATLARRLSSRRRLMQAHREHVYQRLVDRGGLSHGSVTAIVALGSILISAAWLLPPAVATSITALAAIAYLALPSFVVVLRRGVPSASPRRVER